MITGDNIQLLNENPARWIE